MPKVSIIIPVYNVEKYIERCARSLFEQTEEDLEFIFVNDGTPDKSMQILNDVINDYPSRKNQIKIIVNDENIGSYKVRLEGIQKSTGEYIIHCDSDDWVDKDMYGVLYKKAKRENLDIVWCDYYRTDGIVNDYIAYNKKTYRISILKDILNEKRIPFLWIHLVKRSVIFDNDYMKPVASYFEDMVLLIQYVFYSRKFGYINTPFYYYFKNSNSMSTSGSSEKEKKQLTNAEVNLKVVFSFLERKKLGPTLQEEIFHRKYTYQMWALFLVKNIKECNLWINRFKEINIPVLFNPNVRLKDKITFLAIWLRIYPLISQLLRLIRQ